jgi:hypothetical protein
MFRKAKDDELEFKDNLQIIERKLRDAKAKVIHREQQVKKAKFQRDKAKAGYL